MAVNFFIFSPPFFSFRFVSSLPWEDTENFWIKKAAKYNRLDLTSATQPSIEPIQESHYYC